MSNYIVAQPRTALFDFQDKEVRTAIVNDTVWFCAKDVFEAMNITWTSKGTNLKNLPETWQLTLPYQTSYGVKDTIFISEPGVYKVSFRSNKPEAEVFTNWVCEEVLPEIRRNGFYGEIDPKVRIQYSKQITTIVEALTSCKNLMLQQHLISELKDLCRIVGQQVPDLKNIHTDIDQKALPGI